MTTCSLSQITDNNLTAQGSNALKSSGVDDQLQSIKKKLWNALINLFLEFDVRQGM